MQLSWFRTPTGNDAGTTNLCYLATDLPVIRGHATDPAVRTGGETIDYATLLERAAALAGAMRAVGVEPGHRVAVSLDDPIDRLLALLAVLRVGAVHVALPWSAIVRAVDAHEPSLLVTSTSLEFAAHVPPAVFLRGLEVRDEQREVDWEIAVKAGRTDPAECEPVAGDAVAYVHERPVRISEVPGDASGVSRWLSALAAGECLDLDAPVDD